MAKHYKTGKTQRNAVKAYRERKPQKNFCVTVFAEQYAEDKALLDAHKLTTGKFWRWAIEKLKAEPMENYSTDEPRQSEPRGGVDIG